MIPASDIFKTVAKVADDNSPAILAGLGVTGVGVTAFLAARGATHAERILQEEAKLVLDEEARDLTRKERVALVWREYLPAGVVGIGTASAIIMSTRIGMRRTAAMTEAFSISEKAFSEYREKVIEVVGKNKETKVSDSLAQDRVSRKENPSLVIMANDESFVYDEWSDRYFKSSMENLKKARNDLNHRILSQNYASLSDLYDLLGVPHTQISDDIGWNSDKLMDFDFSTCLTPDQKPAISIRYRVEPIRGFYRMS